MSTNHPEKPFMTVVHGRKNVLTAFATLEEAQADAALYWRAGDTLAPSTSVEVHGYDEVWAEWRKLFTVKPGSWELPWADAAAVEPTLSEEAQKAVNQALAPILDIHYPLVESYASDIVFNCAVCHTNEGQDGAAAVRWPCPTAVAAGVTADHNAVSTT